MDLKLKKGIKLCLIIIAIPMLAFAFTWVFPINSPAPYRIMNEKGRPLTLDETWEEKDLFQVKINQIIKLPIDDPSINLDQHKIQSLKKKYPLRGNYTF